MPYLKYIFIVCVALGESSSSIKHTETTTSIQGFRGANDCRMCHNKDDEGAQWSVWNQTAHANTFETLTGEHAIAIGKALGLAQPPAKSPECLECHVTSYQSSTKRTHPKIQLESGVQCESCHGPAEGHTKYAMELRRLNGKSTPTTPIVVEIPDQDTCIQCHNDKSPTWDPERYTLRNGKKVGFNFKQAFKKIEHPNPQISMR